MDPFIVVDVDGSAPECFISNYLDIPFSSERLLHFFLDIEGIGMHVITKFLEGLVSSFKGDGLLVISHSTSVLLKSVFWFGRLVLFLKDLFESLVHWNGSGDSEKSADDGNKNKVLHKTKKVYETSVRVPIINCDKHKAWFWRKFTEFSLCFLNRLLFDWLFESRSAFRGPDDVVPLKLSVACYKYPFFVMDVSGSAPL